MKKARQAGLMINLLWLAPDVFATNLCVSIIILGDIKNALSN